MVRMSEVLRKALALFAVTPIKAANQLIDVEDTKPQDKKCRYSAGRIVSCIVVACSGHSTVDLLEESFV